MYYMPVHTYAEGATNIKLCFTEDKAHQAIQDYKDAKRIKDSYEHYTIEVYDESGERIDTLDA